MRNIVFTLNNYSIEDEAKLRLLIESKAKYVVFGREIAPTTGTPHLQGYIEFNQSRSYKSIKKDINDKIHLESRKGTAEQAAEYCKKESNYEEYGSISKPGERTDLKKIVEGIEQGKKLIEFQREGVVQAFQYSKTLHELEKRIKRELTIELLKEQYQETVWKNWQLNIISMINNKPDARTINWYYEPVGNVGKSYLARYLTLFKEAIVITQGKQADILYSYNGEPIVIFDLSRDYQDMDHIYTVMEVIKNGQYLSTKYESEMRIFVVPHILVFSNWEPNIDKMSEDRWNIVDISSSEEQKPEVKLKDKLN